MTISLIITVICTQQLYTSDLNASAGIDKYRDLKVYEQKLKGEIAQLKGELADKRAYLAKLDKRYLELESQYYSLLEQSNRIAEKLDALHAEESNKW